MVDKMAKYILFIFVYAIGIAGGDFLVRKICKYLEIPGKEKKGLLKAGKFIGYFERFLVITFFLLDSYEIIGFLFAGKSIIRLTNKEESEYFLVGTMASFTFAIMCALFLKFVSLKL